MHKFILFLQCDGKHTLNNLKNFSKSSIIKKNTKITNLFFTILFYSVKLELAGLKLKHSFHTTLLYHFSFRIASAFFKTIRREHQGAPLPLTKKNPAPTRRTGACSRRFVWERLAFRPSVGKGLAPPEKSIGLCPHPYYSTKTAKNQSSVSVFLR